MASGLFYGEICWTKLKVFTLLLPLGCQISKVWVFFLGSGPLYSYKNWHQILSTVKFAEQNSRFLPFLGGICMGGTLWMSNFKILSIFLVPGPQYNYQKWHQVCSTVKFAEQNLRFNLSWSKFVWGVPLVCQVPKFWVRGASSWPKKLREPKFQLSSTEGRACRWSANFAYGNGAWQKNFFYRLNHVIYS
jgi:hypothetical protein